MFQDCSVIASYVRMSCDSSKGCLGYSNQYNLVYESCFIVVKVLPISNALPAALPVAIYREKWKVLQAIPGKHFYYDFKMANVAEFVFVVLSKKAIWMGFENFSTLQE